MRSNIQVVLGMARLMVLTATGGLAFAACGDPETKSAARLAEGCVLNTDCNDPLVCAFKKCHTECEESRDCPEEQRCVASDRPFHVCQLPDEVACTRNIDCPPTMICGTDGECRDACVSSRDCVAGQTCVSRACADPEELKDGKLPVAPSGGGDAATSQPCLLNTDCAAPLVCREGSCVDECREDRDCLAGARCLDRACTAVVAPPPPDAGGPACTYNSDCPGTELCRAGTCAAECRADRDCAPGSTCVEGACARGTSGAGGASGGDGGTDTGGATGAGGAGAGGSGVPQCVYNSDCPAGQLCADGSCRCECRADRDCARGFTCDGCSCQPERPDGSPTEYGSPCGLSSDCAFPLVCRNQACVFECNLTTDCDQVGFCCYAHQCVSGSVCQTVTDGGTGGGDACVACTSNFSCDDGLWCNGQEVCAAGCCAPALDTPCNSHSSCVLDLCDERTHLCRSEAQAAEDADRDGHLDIGCGGDDCDDRSATTFLGAPELCDGIDNDCDGVKDDGSRAPYGPLITYPINGGSDGNGHQSAAVAPVDLGFVAFRHFSGGSTAALGVVGLSPSGAVIESWYSNQVLPGRPQVNQVQWLDAASGGNRALAVYAAPTGANITRVFVTAWTLEGGDAGPARLAHVRTSPVNSPIHVSVQVDPDIVWTGSDFVVGYSDTPSRIGFVSRIDVDGNVGPGVAVPTPAGTGGIASRIHVAASRATVAAVYDAAGTPPLVTVFDSSGGVVTGPVVLPVPVDATLLALAGTSDGYVVATRDSVNGNRTTFVALDGAVGPSLPIAGLDATVVDGDGAGDGTLALFTVWNGGTAFFGATTGRSPLSMTNAVSGFTPGIANLAGYGSSYVVSAGSLGTFQLKRVGCRPAP